MTDFTTKTSSIKEARERIKRCLDEFDIALDLADLGLERVPLELRKLSHISALDLSDNKIRTLPAFLSEFTMLEQLDLSRNHLSTLPEAIGNLVALKVLNLRGNELSTLPDFIERLSQLERLDCSRNKLTAVPEMLGKLPALKNLNLSRNNLKTLPEAVRRLSRSGELSLVQHIEKLAELSREMGLHEDFFDHAKDHIKVVARFFHLSPVQTAVYSHFLVRYEDQHITTTDLSSSLNCESNLGILPWLPEFNELEKKKLLYCRQDEGLRSFRVPEGVVEAIREEDEYKPVRYEGISIHEFFEALNELFYRRGNNELSWDALASDIHTLLEQNTQLVFSQKTLAYQLDSDGEILLLYFCHLLGNQDNDRIWLSPMDSEVYDQKHKTLFRRTRQQFEDSTHVLMRMNLIEKLLTDEENDGFLGDREILLDGQG